jgi:hypothetical protein
MKKSRILMGVLALTIVAAIIIACTKEKEAMVSQSASETITVSKEDDMSAYLKQFKEKMQSAEKGDEVLSLEDARWHLEAVLNYTYGDAGHQTSDIQCDTFQNKLQTNEGIVTLSDINQAFNHISQKVEQTIANCPLPNKSILSIQTRLIDERESDCITLQSLIKTRGLSPFPIHWYVNSTDYWYENDYSGKCGPYEGTCTGKGAVQVIKEKIVLNKPITACNGGDLYYTDFQEITIGESLAWNMLDTNSPHGYRVPCIICPSNEAPVCFSPEDMNYYIYEGLKLSNEFCPSGKVLYDMSNVYMYGVPIGWHVAFHQYTFEYAKPNCDGGGGGLFD